MPMGIVSDKEFDSEKDRVNPSTKREESNSFPKTAVIVDVNKGRGIGNVEVPNTLRTLIGETAVSSGRQEALELASSFGISPSSVSAYANGANSTATIKDRPNAGIINSAKDKIAKRARAKLLLALNNLTPEKIADVKARDLAGIAKDMSAVVRSMEEDTSKNPAAGNSGPTFVFYSPAFFKEERFETVIAKE